MPTQIEVSLVGGEETDRILSELAREYGPRNTRNIFNAPIKKAMEPILQQIKNNTPVDTGALFESVKLRVGRPNARRIRTSNYVDENTVSEGRAGWVWRRGDPVNSYQALAVEFGAGASPPQYILRRALRQNARQAIDILSRELKQNINKTAKRLSRKAAKGTLRR